MLYLGIDLHRKQMTVSLRNEAGDVLQRRPVPRCGGHPADEVFQEEDGPSRRQRVERASVGQSGSSAARRSPAGLARSTGFRVVGAWRTSLA